MGTTRGGTNQAFIGVVSFAEVEMIWPSAPGSYWPRCVIRAALTAPAPRAPPIFCTVDTFGLYLSLTHEIINGAYKLYLDLIICPSKILPIDIIDLSATRHVLTLERSSVGLMYRAGEVAPSARTKA